MAQSKWTKWIWMFKQRCPRCGTGDLYETTWTMHSACPQCGLVFEREVGYFIGSLYISYGMASIFLAVGFMILWTLFPETDPRWLVLPLSILLILVTPLFTRIARVVWLYFDHWAWPLTPDDPPQ